MALKRLTAEEMVDISRGWTEENSEARGIIESCEVTASLLPLLEDSHNTLTDLVESDTSDVRLKDISVEQEALDARHDDLIRGGHMMLTAIAYLLGMGGRGAALLELRDHLIPDGLTSVSKSYRAEAGQAALLEKRVGSMDSQLKSIQVGPDPADTLASFVAEWIAVGKRLGELEDEKTRLQSRPPDATGTERVSARNRWIRVGNALVANAELAQLTDEQMATVFGPLWQAEDTANRRGSTTTKKTDDPNVGGVPV